jgi:DNA-binding response OmpR family regulator
MKRGGQTKHGQGRSLALAHVLVVEDDPVLGMATEDTLREAGVERIDICPTTEGAMEILRTARPDALVRSDGWAIAELVETLGENSPRIVFSTGAPQDIPSDIAELGSVLTKPYAPQDLVRALQQPGRPGLLSRLRGALS